MAFHRVIWIVLDSVGIGPLPDAVDYGDVGRDTLGHIARSRPLQVPNLVRLGLANIAPLAHLTPPAEPAGFFGKGATHSPGKDTTTGHWEMAGIWLDQAFPVYPDGFPRDLIEQFEHAIGRKTIGNKPASGTEIIKELGAEHVRTGFPIVYTSGDSVFQIAAHEEVIPIAELYRMCEIARKMLDGKHRVGRVIARPFLGQPAPDGSGFKRTERRHDYAVEPPRPMLLDVLADRKVPVLGLGKIHDIYNGRGVDNYVTTKNNTDGMEKLRAALRQQPAGLIFINLVDFDMLYGHRKDVEGFARSLEEFDAMLGPFLGQLQPSDLLLITADHGCDPDACSPSTDHSREYVPILAYTPRAETGSSLGIRQTLADMGQTVAENFGGAILRGASFLRNLA
ncbi:MAG: phosphopentomutase [Acidobacteria bacterium]|nr:phosphopentomutase [Acidobacteriota bacterium]MBI3663685.1 phosphopentomutase [Acidobacteriota bacterium]